jgi:hypothetical protein
LSFEKLAVHCLLLRQILDVKLGKSLSGQHAEDARIALNIVLANLVFGCFSNVFESRIDFKLCVEV